MVALLHCSSGCLVWAVLRFIMLQLLQLQILPKLVTQRTCMVRPEESLDLPALLEAVWFSDSVQTSDEKFCSTFAGDGGAQSPCQILRYFNVLYWYLLIFLIGAMIWWSDIWSSGYCRHVVPGRRYGIGALGTPELRWSVIYIFFSATYGLALLCFKQGECCSVQSWKINNACRRREWAKPWHVAFPQFCLLLADHTT